MKEKILDIPTKDGAIETFVCHPERGGPYPPVLFLMDAPGIREELYDMARRLATVGLLRAAAQPLLPRRQGHQVWPRRPGEGQRRAGAHAGGADQDDDPAGDGRRRRHDRLRRRAEGVEEGTGRHPWLLHERPLFAGRRRALSRPHRRRRLVLRHLAGERRRRKPASHARQGQGRALHLLRRARRARAARHGEGTEGAVRQVGQSAASWRSRWASITASPSRNAGATTSRPPNGTGSA